MENWGILPRAALNQGRLLLETILSEMRLLFEGGCYLRAALNNDFTVFVLISIYTAVVM